MWGGGEAALFNRQRKDVSCLDETLASLLLFAKTKQKRAASEKETRGGGKTDREERREKEKGLSQSAITMPSARLKRHDVTRAPESLVWSEQGGVRSSLPTICPCPFLSLSLSVFFPSSFSFPVCLCVCMDVGAVEQIIGLLTAPLPKSGHMKRPFPGHSFTAVPDEHGRAR